MLPGVSVCLSTTSGTYKSFLGLTADTSRFISPISPVPLFCGDGATILVKCVSRQTCTEISPVCKACCIFSGNGHALPWSAFGFPCKGEGALVSPAPGLLQRAASNSCPFSLYCENTARTHSSTIASPWAPPGHAISRLPLSRCYCRKTRAEVF